MNIKSLIPAALAGTFGIASLSAGAATLYADPVPVESATRTVVIDSNTKWVNATELERVKFVSNGKEFAVDFDGLRSEFLLNDVAPAGVLDHPVKAYVMPAPGGDAAGG